MQSPDVSQFSQPEYEMGSHEPFDLYVTQENQIKTLKAELKEKEDFGKHLMWHCMIYRETLKRVQGGCNALKSTLNDFKEDGSDFNTCACCEYDYYKELIQDFYKKSQKEVEGDSQLNAHECANCQNDAMMIKISNLHSDKNTQ